MAASGIDNAQTRVSQCAISEKVSPFIIGPTMPYRGEHSPQGVPVPIRARSYNAGNAAHKSGLGACIGSVAPWQEILQRPPGCKAQEIVALFRRG